MWLFCKLLVVETFKKSSGPFSQCQTPYMEMEIQKIKMWSTPSMINEITGIIGEVAQACFVM